MIGFFRILDHDGEGLDGNAIDLKIVFLFVRAVGEADDHSVFSELYRDLRVKTLHELIGGRALEDRDGIGAEQKIAHAEHALADDGGGNAISLQNVSLCESELRLIVILFFAGDRANEQNGKKQSN